MAPVSHYFSLFFRLEIQEENHDWIEYATVLDSLAYTVKNLKPGCRYRFRIRAENIHGRSEPGEPSEEVRISLGYAISPATIQNQMESKEISIKSGGDFKTRFDIQDELGKGRFGVVYKVVERDTGQILAAKIVKCIKAKDKEKVGKIFFYQ